MRIGVALLIPSPVKEELDGLRRALGDGSLTRIDSHITLVPPVNIPEQELDDVVGSLRAAALDCTSLELLLGPVQTFAPESPVLYLDVRDRERVVRLRDAVFVGPLQRRLTFPFYPHVTVCDDADEARIASGLIALDRYEAKCTIDSVHLLCEGEHRRWDPIAEVRFATPFLLGRGGLETVIEVGSYFVPDAQRFANEGWHRYDVQNGVPEDVSHPYAMTSRQGAVVVGVVEGTISGETIHLARMIVGEEIRRQGIGHNMLNRVLEYGRQHDCVRVTLRVLVDGPLGFFESHGFSVDYSLPNWHAGRDFVQMRRTL